MERSLLKGQWTMATIPYDDLWQPLVLDMSIRMDRVELQRLRDGHRVLWIHDRLAAQLAELLSVRAPERQRSAQERAQAMDEILAGQAMSEFGRWIYYPWSGVLCHLLPPNEFRELRLDRNRNKLTTDEQRRLDGVTIGVVGLSTGATIATTLALEGAAGHIKLADFDHLELSNLNRTAAAVHNLGLRKAVLCARQIVELNPYARVTPYPLGITASNVDEFMTGEPRCDMVIDTCDAAPVKQLLRATARTAGIPVIAATNDRGLLDVERFDQEPKHEDRQARQDRVATVLDVVGPDAMSARLGASVVEVRHSLSAWPQLASEAVLSAAVVTAAVRRIALAARLTSGRRYLDLDRHLDADPELPCPRGEIAPSARATDLAAPPLRPALATALIEAAMLAPSAGNSQPWIFHVDGDRIWLVHDRRRSLGLLNRSGRAPRVALGAALENMVVEATARGRHLDVRTYPFGPNSTVVAEVGLVSDSVQIDEESARLAPFVRLRHTNRRAGSRLPLASELKARLAAIATAFGVILDLRYEEAELHEAADVIAEGERMRLTCDELHRDTFAELRFTPGDAAATCDGIDVETLELSAEERALLDLVARKDVARLLRERQGHCLGDSSRRTIATSSAIGLLRVTGTEIAQQLHGGRAFQRIWLALTEEGLALQPVTALPYMIELLDRNEGRIYAPHERILLHQLDGRIERLFGRRPGAVPLVLFRIGQAEESARRSLRRPLADVVLEGPPPRR